MFQVSLLRIILVCNVFSKFTANASESEKPFSFTANQDYAIEMINKEQSTLSGYLALSNIFATPKSVDDDKKYKRKKIRGHRRRTVVGGTYSPLDRYPYIVSLQYSLSAAGYKHTCGGALIAKDIILTAAHCYKQSYNHLPRVIVGDHNLINSNDGGEQFVTRQLISHPEWDRRLLSNDIMLIQIYGSSSRNPIKLNEQSNFPVSRQELDILGWGASRQDGKIYPDTLKETKLDYITNKDCFNMVADAFKTLMCTMDLDGVLDEGICYGDSGGPLIAKGESGLPSDDILVGIVSALLPPCASPNPDYYSRVSGYYGWIRQTVCSISLSPPEYFQCTKNNMNTDPTHHLPSISPSSSSMSSPSSLNNDEKTKKNKVPLTIVFRLDENPKDMIWALYETDESNKKNGVYHDAIYSQMEGYSSDLGNEFVVEHIYLEKNKQFSIYFFDKYGDGSCCESGIGYMFLYWGHEDIGTFDEKNVMIWSLGNSYTSSLVYQFNTTVPPEEHRTSSSMKHPLANDYHEFITMKLSFDALPFQISWEITSQDGETVYAKKPKYTYRVSAFQTVTEIVHLPAFERLLFRIKDDDSLFAATISSNNSNYYYGGILSLQLFEGQPTENNKLYEIAGNLSEEIFSFELTKLKPTEFPSVASTETISSAAPSQVPTKSPSLIHHNLPSNGGNMPIDRPSSSPSSSTNVEVSVEEQSSSSTESIISSSPEVIPNTIQKLQNDGSTSKSVRVRLDVRFQVGICVAMIHFLTNVVIF